MFELKLLVFGAVVVLAAVSPALADLRSECRSLSEKLALVSTKKDRQLAFSVAQDILKSNWKAPFRGSRSKLAKAWEVVHDLEGPCDSKLLTHLASITECDLMNRENMKENLLADTRDYLRKCLKDELWTEALNKTVNQFNKDEKSVSALLNSNFIREFIAIHEKAWGTKAKCYYAVTSYNPSLAGQATLDALVAYYKGQATPILEQFKRDPKLVGEKVKKLIVKPCAKYASSMRWLILALSGAMQITDDTEFPERLPEEFREAWYRYAFCSSLEFNLDEKHLTDAILNQVKHSSLIRPTQVVDTIAAQERSESA